MPELAEVARVVHFIRAHLVGRTIATVTAKEDEKVFGAVGTSASEYEAALTGKKIVGAGQQGKYFWLELSSAPHAVMHFGMTGWLHLRHVNSFYYGGASDAPKEWPPKFWKFHLATTADGDRPPVEAAFVDARRFGRARLVDCAAADIRSVSPLKENGPDPVADKEIVTAEWLAERCGQHRVPIKAFLLDQANISGIGNWIGDDVLYNARIHPETTCDALSKEQIERLHASIHYICSTACDLLGETDKLPETWLVHYRKGDSLPTGERITWLTVGGRSSAVIATVQKKSGKDGNEEPQKPGRAKAKKAKAVAAEADEKPAKLKGKKVKVDDVEEDEKPAKSKGKSAKADGAEAEGKATNSKGKPAKADANADEKPANASSKKTKAAPTSSTDADQPSSKRRKVEASVKHEAAPSKAKASKADEAPAAEGRRRSQRHSGRA